MMTVLAVTASSLFVGMHLPAPVGIGGYVDMIAFDLIGLSPILAIVTGAGSLVAFLTAELVVWKTRWARVFVFAVAGLVMMIVMLKLMEIPASGAQPIGRAQFLPNYLTLLAIGALGGWLFGRLTEVRAD